MKLNILLSVATLATLTLVGCGSDNTDDTPVQTLPEDNAKVLLGKKFYSDKTLSKNGTMSCATCHSLEEGLVDPRSTSKVFGASLGDNAVSIGDRNAPTAAYATFSPAFHFDDVEGLYIGGQFLDGRASDLKAQAKGPFLNPLEMGMPNAAAVVNKVRENSTYVIELKNIYGNDIFDNNDNAYDSIAESIASFEKSKTFSPFDSKFDKYLAGEYTLTESENRGMLIYSNEEDELGAGKCTLCHPITKDGANTPLMTDYSYDNLGVPINIALRNQNGQTGRLDSGLLGNPTVTDTTLEGSFKVSSLRNIAVTGPYMHNGVFKELKTVVHFYNTRDTGGINPETGAAWEVGEFHNGRNQDELGDLGLTSTDEDDLVAFLKTFTDTKYESLIK